jgi:hypothetical protein
MSIDYKGNNPEQKISNDIFEIYDFHKLSIDKKRDVLAKKEKEKRDELAKNVEEKIKEQLKKQYQTQIMPPLNSATGIELINKSSPKDIKLLMMGLMPDELPKMSYTDVCQTAFKNYQNTFGYEKYDKVVKKVYESNKISGLISRCKFHIQTVDHLTILSYINVIPYFLFSKPETEAIAALLVLLRWNEEVNAEYKLKSNDDLKGIAVNIIERTKTRTLLY